MKKLIISISALVIVVLVFTGYSLSRYDIQELVICTTNKESHYIPMGVCEYYMVNYRITPADIQQLEKQAGLSFLLGLPDKHVRQDLVRLFNSRGADVNKHSAIDGYAPLHAAIINNDADMVKLLLSLGANKSLKDANGQMDAMALLSSLTNRQPDIDRSAVIKALQ